MGHELHGDWHLYVVRAINAAGTLGLVDLGKMHIEMPNAGNPAMQPGSKIGNNDLVRGSAIPTNGVYSVTFQEQLPGSPPTFRPYAGFLIDRRDTPSGDRVLVMNGFRGPIGAGPGITASHEAEAQRINNAVSLASQEEGTWVATKP